MELQEEVIGAIDHAIHLMKSNQTAPAVIEFTNILNKHPNNALAWNNRGMGLLQLGHPFDAILNVEKAIALAPEAAEYYLNLGACYAEMEETARAMAFYHKCIELNPKIAQAYMNMGNALKYSGRAKEALPYYRKCTEVDPNYIEGRLVRAFGELLLGNYKEGWEEFEIRWKSDQCVPRGLPIKEWNGEPLEGKTLMIYGEQGHGDSLQFVRYANMVKQKYGGTIWYECRYPLIRLLQSVEGIDRVVRYGDELPLAEIDYMVAVMSLPRILGTTVDTIPWPGPYFKAEKYRAGLWKERLKVFPKGLKVGICWAGASRPGRPNADAIDKKRSMTLADFAPLGQVAGISWVALQKGAPRDQVMAPPLGMTIGDWSDDFDDFYDTAALIDCLDLVISVDTAVVHLAAGMGKPTWMLSRWDGCWRWLGNRPDSPWYPSIRVFGQPAPNSWDPVVKDLAVALRQFVKSSMVKAA